ncbi:hypothetical protein DSCO28_21200 [Desulfosarcina ovata subsp. sediminis]|uniref:Uncharacterized protein n=1 Tax=Desulfosarcina ovata subsp. sediminis TaxID=885957 RepID=A0A5K7ZJJ4_9BACT|nr:hypothetical protein DSCO28_21200 [Desulfosarcina ovata subsp. sediminis]
MQISYRLDSYQKHILRVIGREVSVTIDVLRKLINELRDEDSEIAFAASKKAYAYIRRLGKLGKMGSHQDN